MDGDNMDNLFEEEENNKIEEIDESKPVKNNSNNNKKNILIVVAISIAIVLVITLIIVLVNISSKNKNRDNNNDIVEKESVTIAGKSYTISDTTELVLTENNLSLIDIKNISKLENLNKLDIKNTTLDDISFISNLKKLNVLKINVNPKVSDYSVLSNLDNLFTLEIYGNIGTTSNLSSFSKLKKVSTLYLTMNNERNLDFLNDMTGLSLLSLDCPVPLYNKILKMLEEKKVKINTHGSLSKKDTNEIPKVEDGIIKWSQYDCDSTEVLTINLTSDYSDVTKLQNELNKLANYKNLKSLTITTDNYQTTFSINNFNFLKNMNKLEILSINYLNSNDINSIGNLTSLKKLNITNGNMANSKFTSISNLTNLTELNLSMQNITDITFLSKLVNLEKLYLNGNNITNLSPIQNLIKLKELYIGCNNALKDFSAIESLINLNIIMMTPEKVDVNIFKNLTKLKNIYVGIALENIDELKKNYPNITIEEVTECV